MDIRRQAMEFGIKDLTTYYDRLENHQDRIDTVQHVVTQFEENADFRDRHLGGRFGGDRQAAQEYRKDKETLEELTLELEKAKSQFMHAEYALLQHLTSLLRDSPHYRTEELSTMELLLSKGSLELDVIRANVVVNKLMMHPIGNDQHSMYFFKSSNGQRLIYNTDGGSTYSDGVLQYTLHGDVHPSARVLLRHEGELAIYLKGDIHLPDEHIRRFLVHDARRQGWLARLAWDFPAPFEEEYLKAPAHMRRALFF